MASRLLFSFDDFECSLKYHKISIRCAINRIYDNENLTSEKKEILAEPYRQMLEDLEKNAIESQKASK